MSEINVTPFVDVMLVLLIVFMITAPLLTVGVPVDLPKTKAQLLSQPEEPLVISVNAKGEIYVQETSVPLESLVPRLIAITENNADTRIYLRGDRSIDYGRMMQVMGYVNAAGFRRVALIAELPDANEDAADKDDDRNG
jgi:biopolymer transport protein TolR